MISSFQACLKWSNKPIAFDLDCSCKPLPCQIADRILGALSSPPFTAAPFKYHLPMLAAADAGYLIDTLLQRPPHTIPPFLFCEGCSRKVRLPSFNELQFPSSFSKEANAMCTELRKFLCTWFGEVCSCCRLSHLPQLACNILATTYKEIFSAL